jgi:hypothetical protein
MTLAGDAEKQRSLWMADARKKRNVKQARRSVEGEYRVEGSVLDELGVDRQAALELKLKAALHQKILLVVRRRSKIIKVKGVGQECPTHTVRCDG